MIEKKPYKWNNCDTSFAFNCILNQHITSVNKGKIKLKQHVGAVHENKQSFKRDAGFLVSTRLKKKHE